jgi:hypothetical protein
MSCEDFFISADGRKGVGVVQPQSGLDFPLVSPSGDVALLLADFHLSYDDPGYYTAGPAPEFVHPLRIEWIYGIGCDESESSASEAVTHSADLRVVDANNVVVFDSTEATYFDRHAWSADYEIIEWRTSDAVCRAVAYTSWASAFEPKDFPLSFYPENAVLDERAVQKLPRRVRTIKVRQGNIVLGTPIAVGSGRFEAGYNMNLTVTGPTTTALRRGTNVTFAAEPRKEYNDCNDEPSEPVIAINGVRGNDGDFTITGADCVYARRPTTLGNGEVTPQTHLGANGYYKIGSDCPACCDCPDYVESATYMNRIRNRYKTIGKRTHEVKILHEDNIQRWIENRECRLEKPLKIVMTPQCCPIMDVLVMFCNQCQSCAENVVLNVAFGSFPGGTVGVPQCGFTIMYAPGVSGEKVPLLGVWPNFAVALPPVDVGNSAYVKFRLKFDPREYPYAINATLTGTKGGSPVRAGCDDSKPAATAFAVKTLNCDDNGNNLEIC